MASEVGTAEWVVVAIVVAAAVGAAGAAVAVAVSSIRCHGGVVGVTGQCAEHLFFYFCMLLAAWLLPLPLLLQSQLMA